MTRELGTIVDEAVAVGRDFDVVSVPLPETYPLYERIERAIRVLAGIQTLLAPRVASSREWVRRGCANPAELLASAAGTTSAAARRQLDTGERAGRLAAVATAMRSGELSADQASVVADAASTNPAAERSLLDAAATQSFRELRQAAGRAKAAADSDPDATHRRIHARRAVRTWTEADGTWNLHATGTVAAGARIEQALDRRTRRIFERARQTDRRERHEAYRFEALVAMADSARDDAMADGRAGHGAGPPASKRSNVRHLTLLRLDVAALQRGRPVGGELCEIAGVGPVPVSVARELLGDSVVKLVLTRGVDVLNVTHLGRGPTAAQLAALLWRGPLCTNSACDRRWREIDHRIDWAATHHTRLDELDPLCDFCHDRKTRDNWALVDGKGRRPFVPPDDPRHPRHRHPRQRRQPFPPGGNGDGELPHESRVDARANRVAMSPLFDAN